MTATHTPGPWDIGYAQADDIVIVGPDKELEICTVWSDPNVCDAKLIAAAPDLLEALIYLLGDVEPCGCESPHDDEYCLIKIAEKAIAKATGGAA